MISAKLTNMSRVFFLKLKHVRVSCMKDYLYKMFDLHTYMHARRKEIATAILELF